MQWYQRLRPASRRQCARAGLSLRSLVSDRPRGRIHGWTNKMTYNPNQPCVAGKLYLSIVEGSGARAASTGRGF